MRQRGCEYCLDYRHERTVVGEKYHKLCIYNKCPYHELDDVNTYSAYLKASKMGKNAIAVYIRKIFDL